MEWWALKQPGQFSHSIHAASVCSHLPKGVPASLGDTSLWPWMGEGKSVHSREPDYSSLVCSVTPLILSLGGFHVSSVIGQSLALERRGMWFPESHLLIHAHSALGNRPGNSTFSSPMALWVHFNLSCTHLRIWLSYRPSPNCSLYFCNSTLNHDYYLIYIMDIELLGLIKSHTCAA